jgi:type I restriction enzyme R subunit
MSAHAYTEDQLVEQPAKRLLAELGWRLAQAHPHPDPLPAAEGVWFDETGLCGRETKGEVVLVSRLRAAPDEITQSP